MGWDLVPVSLNEGVGIIPWGALAAGWLPVGIPRGAAAPPPGSGMAENAEAAGNAWERYATEPTWLVVDTLADAAKQTGRGPAHVALRWLTQRPGVTAPIIGARTPTELEDNLAAG